MSTGPDVQATFVATLVDEWVRGGVTDAVVAPGSRSTPVLAALAADGRIRLHVVVDERSGGFVALGIGAATGRPAPMVTTSGTAAVELHPAVVEAHQARVPLLVVTADRPAELHHVGAPQTVEQVGLYGPVCRWAVSPGVADDTTSASWRPLGARTVIDTMHHPAGPGPVHLNLELREPLLGFPGPLPAGRPDGAPWQRVVPAGAPPDGQVAVSATVDVVVAARGRRGVIVAGAGAPPETLALAEALDWPVLADPRSGCRVPHPLVVAAADSLLRIGDMARPAPDVVVGLGQPWASKVVSQWLAGLGPATTRVLVDPAGAWVDPERTASVVDRSEPGALCQAVLARLRSSSPGGPARDLVSAGPDAGAAGEWSGRWRDAEGRAQAAIAADLARRGGPTEPGVARAVVAALPAGASLVVSSSMPVRDVEWWGAPRTGLRVVANRGANGIDGIVSTAIGVAVGTGAPTACLIGDLAFVYDAGALLGAAARPVSLTFVVVDNDGGGIFSFLPQAKAVPADRFERLWSTPHGLDLVDVARAYGVDAVPVARVGDLAAALAEVRSGVRVLVVRTDRAANVVVHDELNAAVAATVTAGIRAVAPTAAP
jgi:2-succinyl-5-enolpyruvyl-6-hydroxy-3-cyclohexene-1-carboxylate synthase